MTSTNWFSRIRSRFLRQPATRTGVLDLLGDERLRTEIDSEEIGMLRGVLEVSETQVRDVMIPRAHMVVIGREAPREKVLKTISQSGHSRFPVIGEDRDEVAGVLLAKDVLAHIIAHPAEPFDIERFLRPATVIPESKRLNTLLKEFRVSRNHMAIVVDEYGNTSGLLTIEDVLEEIVGEIDDEHDPQAVELISAQDDTVFLVRALTRIEDFNEYFGSELEDEEYDTIGGLVIQELGRMPRRGETVSVDGFHFKVVQADKRRVHTLEVRRDDTSSGSDSAVAP